MKKIKGKIFRRMIALFAAAAVWCAGLCLPVSAAETKVTDGISWSLDKAAGTMTIYGVAEGMADSSSENSELWRTYGKYIRHIHFTGKTNVSTFFYLPFVESVSVDCGNYLWTLDKASKTLTLTGSGMVSDWTFIDGYYVEHLIIGDGITGLSDNGYFGRELRTMMLGKDFQLGSRYSCVPKDAFYVSPQNPYYSVYNGMIYSKDYSTLIRSQLEPKTAAFHPNLKTLGEECLTAGNQQLVVIPRTVTRIGKNVIPYMDAGTVVIPEGIQEIDASNDAVMRWHSRYNVVISKHNAVAMKVFTGKYYPDYTIFRKDSIASYYEKLPEPAKWGWSSDGLSYYENGEKVTGYRFISGKRCYFNEQGVLAEAPEKTRPATTPAKNSSGCLLGREAKKVKGQFDWDPASSTLTIPSGAKITEAIQFDDSITGTVTAVIQGNASMTVCYGGGITSALAASNASLIMKGGTLKITGTGNAAGGDVYGVSSGFENNLALDGTRLTVDLSAVNGAAYSCALYSDGDFSAKNSNVSAKTAPGLRSVAVRALGDFVQHSGSITAQGGGSAKEEAISCGVWFGGKGQLDGKLIAAGGKLSGRPQGNGTMRSLGVYAGGPTVISGDVQAKSDEGMRSTGFYYGSNMTVTGSLKAECSEKMPFHAADGISGRGALTIDGGRVTADGKNGVGLYTSDSIQINGGRLEASGKSYSIQVRQQMTLSRGDVKLTGGAFVTTLTIKGGTLNCTAESDGEEHAAGIQGAEFFMSGGKVNIKSDYGIICDEIGYLSKTALLRITGGRLNVQGTCSALTVRRKPYENAGLEIGSKVVMKSGGKKVTAGMGRPFGGDLSIPCIVDSSGNIVTNLQISG